MEALVLQMAKRVQGCWKLIPMLCTILVGACMAHDLEPKLNSQPRVHEVEIKKFRFKPQILSISPGDSVRWVNRDIVPHRVADADQKIWHSNDMAPEDSFSEPILVSTTYICTLHPGMQANIVVREN